MTAAVLPHHGVCQLHIKDLGLGPTPAVEGAQQTLARHLGLDAPLQENHNTASTAQPVRSYVRVRRRALLLPTCGRVPMAYSCVAARTKQGCCTCLPHAGVQSKSLTFFWYGLSAAMGCTPARSVTLMVVAADARLVLVDMGVKGGWRLTEGVTAGVPFNLHMMAYT